MGKMNLRKNRGRIGTAAMVFVLLLIVLVAAAPVSYTHLSCGFFRFQIIRVRLFVPLRNVSVFCKRKERKIKILKE